MGFWPSIFAGSELILEQWKRLRSESARSQHEIEGVVSLGCHPSVALYTLFRFLPQLLTERRPLNINLRHDLSRCLTEDVISFRLDLSFVVNPISHPDLVIHQLCTDKVWFWISESLQSETQQASVRKRTQKKKNGKNRTAGTAIKGLKATKIRPLGNRLGSLASMAQRQLIYDPSLAQSSALISQLRNFEEKSIDFEHHLHSSNLEVVRDLTEHRTGVAILPARVAKLARKRLVPFEGNSPWVEDRICLVHRGDIPKTAAIRAIINGIKSQDWTKLTS